MTILSAAIAAGIIWGIWRLHMWDQPKHRCARIVVRDGEVDVCECGKVLR